MLDPADYRRLRVGQDRAAVERVLPCVELLGVGRAYRLCFARDRLIGKDVMSPAPGGLTRSPPQRR